jgi:hypothetical protein
MRGCVLLLLGKQRSIAGLALQLGLDQLRHGVVFRSQLCSQLLGQLGDLFFENRNARRVDDRGTTADSGTARGGAANANRARKKNETKKSGWHWKWQNKNDKIPLKRLTKHTSAVATGCAFQACNFDFATLFVGP